MHGTHSKKRIDELYAPVWISVAQLLFAAVLLYVVRNPAPVQALEASLQPAEEQQAVITLHFPASNVAVAATEPEIIAKQPM